MTLNAFMGALDDIAQSAVDIDTSAGEEFANRVMGLFDTASEFYDEDMVKNMELVRALGARLGEMACGGHGHFSDAFSSVSEKFGLLKKDDQDSSHEGHNHEEEAHEDSHDPDKCKKCKAGERCSRK